MSKIRTSIHGRLVGLNHNDELQIGKGLVLGEHGRQYRSPASKIVSIFDDFADNVLSTNWTLKVGTDPAVAKAILAGGIGGVMRLTTGAAGTGFAADGAELVSNLQWQASNGGLAIEARFKLSAITTCTCFFGFTDLAATLEDSIYSSGAGDGITTDATDAVGFLFDTRMTTKNWWLTGVKADVDATKQDSTKTPTANQYQTFRIEITDTGSADFFINGLQVGTRMVNALAIATDLTPVLTISKTSVAASMTLDLDYIHVTMNRLGDGVAD